MTILNNSDLPTSLETDKKQPTGLADFSAGPALLRNLIDYSVIIDPAYSHLTKNRILGDTNDISLVSGKYRRHIYIIKNDLGHFYLKLSPLSHPKDRLRFLFLPWRISAEWRNLGRLSRKGINAARRVLFGYKGIYPNRGFFLVTEAINGSPINPQAPDQIQKLAAYLASLHAAGVLHRDIHPGNILLDHHGKPSLLDTQEVYFLPWIPRRIRITNLGNMWWHIRASSGCPMDLGDFLAAYNSASRSSVGVDEITSVINRRQQRHYRSRSRRCCKNSTEFQIIKNGQGLKGFKRRDFTWGKTELQTALGQGAYIKDEKLITHKNICIKIHHKRFLHQDRSLASWKMARALDVMGINVPAALAYFVVGKNSYFLNRFYDNSMTLNDYLSSDFRAKEKKSAVRAFAEWLRACHDLNVWQRDFKSSNVLVLDKQFMMVDLDGVKIRRHLPWRKKLINLAQLNASVSNRLTLKDRLRLFHYYCREERPSRKARRQAYQRIWAITKQKNTSPFGLDPEALKPPRKINLSTGKR